MLKQCLISVAIVLTVSSGCLLISPFFGYRVIAFVLLLTVSILAMLFDIVPVMLAATLSALIWYFFYIPPSFTFHIESEEDVILLLMYFVIALINTVLMFRIRKMEKKALKKEERLNRLKVYETLLSSLSHELKTPISTIVAATDNLQSNTASLTQKDKDELVSEIAKASFRLNQQVENLLNMSKLESKVIKPKPAWQDLSEVVYTTVKKVEEDKPLQRINIHIKPNLPPVRIDYWIIEQILYNLISNARLHTPSGSTIDVTALVHGSQLELIVEDNGPGFPPGEIENVFDKFYRVKNTSAGGTGLGLSIVKGFTEIIKGQISLENRLGGGARFSVIIPCEQSTIRTQA